MQQNSGSFVAFWVFGHRVIRKGCLTDWMLFFGVPYISSATGMHNGSNNQFYWEKSTDSSEIPRNSWSFGEFWIWLASDKNSLLQKNNYNHSMRTIMKLVIRWSVMAESFPHIRVHFQILLTGGVAETFLVLFIAVRPLSSKRRAKNFQYPPSYQRSNHRLHLSRLAGFQRDSLKRKYQHVRQKNKKKNNNHENHSGANVPAARWEGLGRIRAFKSL